MAARTKFIKGVEVTGSLPAGTDTIGAVLIKDSGGDEASVLTPADGVSTALKTLQVFSELAGYNETSTQWNRIRALAAGDADAGMIGLVVNARQQGWTGSAYDRFRAAKLYKPFTADAVANNATHLIWTPAAGKRFRILGGILAVSVTGDYLLGEYDTTPTLTNNILPILLTANTPTVFGFGNGWLANNADRVARLKNASGSAANVRGILFGTDE